MMEVVRGKKLNDRRYKRKIEDRRGEKRRYKRGKNIDKNGHDPPMGG